MAESLLTIEHLTKKFGDDLILDDLNLTVYKGEVIVVVGPSGCGKSTLLRCINALEPIQGGTIKLKGELIDPKSKDLTRLRQKIGMVFQNYELFPPFDSSRQYTIVSHESSETEKGRNHK